MTPSSVSISRQPAASPAASGDPAKTCGSSPAGERSALEAALRGGHGAAGPESPRVTGAGKAHLPYVVPPGEASVFAHLLRQPWALQDGNGTGVGAAGGGQRSALHSREGSGRSGPPRREAALDAFDATGSRLQPLQPPVALSATVAQSVAERESTAPAELRAHVTLEDLVPALVRKIAWSGDGVRGAMRIELGGGVLSGATLLVRSDEGRVRVHLTAPAGTDLDDWRARIARRLAGRGVVVDEIEVD